jgi:hypothetical protein
VIIVEREISLYVCAVFAPGGGHQLHFARLVLPKLIAAHQIEDVCDGMLLETVAGLAARFAHKHDGELLRFRVHGHLHHAAAHLIATPDGVARENVRRFEARLAVVFEAEEQEVCAGHGRDVRLVEPDVFASPQNFPALAVNRIQRLLRAEDDHAQLRQLVETHVAVEARRPTGGNRRSRFRFARGEKGGEAEQDEQAGKRAPEGTRLNSHHKKLPKLAVSSIDLSICLPLCLRVFVVSSFKKHFTTKTRRHEGELRRLWLVYNRAAPLQNGGFRRVARARGIYIFSPDRYKLGGERLDNQRNRTAPPILSAYSGSGRAVSSCSDARRAAM